MISIMTLAGGGLTTLRRLINSINKHLKIKYRHFILCQGDKEVQDHLMSLDHLNRYSIFSPINMNISNGYNTLLEVALEIKPKSDFFMFLDDDFELHSDAPSRLFDYLKKHNLDAVAMEHSWYNAKPKNHLVKECGGGTVLFSRKVAEDVGYMDENLYSEWDADWTRRMTYCHNFKLAIANGSKSWARHFHQTGQRKHGMERFRKLQKKSIEYIRKKWKFSGIAGTSIATDANSDVIKEIKSNDPLKRKSSSRGSGMIIKMNGGIYKL